MEENLQAYFTKRNKFVHVEFSSGRGVTLAYYNLRNSKPFIQCTFFNGWGATCQLSIQEVSMCLEAKNLLSTIITKTHSDYVPLEREETEVVQQMTKILLVTTGG